MRLPAKPKIRLHGEGASNLVGRGNSLLMRVHQVADAAGVPVYALWAKFDDGSAIRAAKIGPINVIDCYSSSSADNPINQPKINERLKTLPSRLLWVPQGIVCTPRSRTVAPKGWGIPDGQPGGALPQVLINQYPHNNYPDILFRLLHPPPGLKRERLNNTQLAMMTWMTAPGLYMDYEQNLRVMEFTTEEHPNYLPITGGEQPVGVYDPRIEVTEEGNTWPGVWSLAWREGWLPVVPQRAGLAEYRTIPMLFEPLGEGWFVHRPQPVELMRPEELKELDPDEQVELLSDLSRFIVVDDVTADVMDGVDRIRSAYGKMPINRMPLRGDYGVLSDMVLTETTGIGSIPHESEEFREGYQLFPQRVRRALKPRGAENLAASMGPTWPRETLGNEFIDMWENSPIHLENIVTAWPRDDDPEFSYAAAPVRFKPGVFMDGNDRIGMTFAAQTFTRTDAWPWPKIAHHVGDFGTVGWSSEPTTNRYHCSTAPTQQDADGNYQAPSLLLMAGYVSLPRYRESTAIIIGAALCGLQPTTDDPTGPMLESVRVAVLSGAFGTEQSLTLSIETWALQDLPTDDALPLQMEQMTLPPYTRVTRFNFTRDGSKGGAVAYSKLGPYQGRTATVLRTILNDGGDDSARVNPGTGATVIRYEVGKLTPAEQETLLVSVDVDTQDRDRVQADDPYFPYGDTIRYNRYTATCQGEYTAFIDYTDDGSELLGKVRVNIETDLRGSFAIDDRIASQTHAYDRGTGRYSDDGEYTYNFLAGWREVKLADSRGFPPPPDALYRHIEKVEIVTDSGVIPVTDFYNVEHWGKGIGFTRAIAHLDLREPEQLLTYRTNFDNGDCTETWEQNGQPVGEPLVGVYDGSKNFLGEPRFLPPITAASAIGQGVGKVRVVAGEDHFTAPYPTDLINEKYLSDFRTATVLYPWDTTGGQMGVPLEDFYAVLSPDLNEGSSYGLIVGGALTDSQHEQSWKVGPRLFHAVAKAPPSYPIKDPVELIRAEQALEYRGQWVTYDTAHLAAMNCAVLLGNPHRSRELPDYWDTSIDDLADTLGVDEFDNIGDIGLA